MKAMRISGFLVALAAMSGCSNLDNNTLTYVNYEPISASQDADISNAARLAVAAVNSQSDSTETINLEQVTTLSGTKGLSNYRRDRAYAIGYPKECGGSWHAWSYQGKYAAAEGALSGCIGFREGFDEHTDAKCSCRLVLLNKTVLGSPRELNLGLYQITSSNDL